MYAFVVGAPKSGSGKTMVSLGLMRALSERGLRVSPFKSGPDYIDTQFHAVACGGRESVNLDLFMGSRGHVCDLFGQYAEESDVAIVEGAMGLFDGMNGMEGSAADLAIMLSLPVVLVVDAPSMAFSAAPLIYGFSRFRDDLRIAGVIFNRVASARHRDILAEAARAAGVECLGFIGRKEGLKTPSRHLGLTLGAKEEMEQFVKEAARAVEGSVDLGRLCELTRLTSSPVAHYVRHGAETSSQPTLKVAVAYDEAFNFIYKSNLRSLEQSGARIELFSPIRSRQLPEGVDMVYLPGGYPELWAERLEANKEMRLSIREFGERGGRILAECGGLIYLCRGIDGREMCGLLPLEATMENARLTLGYRSVELGGLTLRGHEFHYSHLVDPDLLPSVCVQKDGRGNEVKTRLYRYKNAFAGYTHLYFGETDIMRLWK